MKRTLIVILISLFSLPAFCQIEEEEENAFKPKGGDKTLEVQFIPFGDTPININGIRYRKFSSSTRAFRLNVFLGVSSNTTITQQENTDFDLEELKNKEFALTMNFRPGFERHFKGTERLSPYLGMEGDLAYRTNSTKVESQFGDDIHYEKLKNDQGFFRIGVNAIAGFDYYFSKKIYMGTEFGYGLSLTKLLSVKRESDFPAFEEPDPAKRGSSFNMGPNVNAQIRLGYVFN